MASGLIEALDPVEIAEKLLGENVGELFQSDEVRKACCTALEGVGIRPPLNGLLVFLAGGLLGGVVVLLRERAVQGLARLIESVPALRALFCKILQICASCENRIELKSQLLETLRGSRSALEIQVDVATPLEVLVPLEIERAQLETRTQILAAFRKMNDELVSYFEGAYEPRLEDPRPHGSQNDVSLASSLRFATERDPFVGRERELNFLDRLISDETLTVKPRPVLWQLITGTGGEGKSRLALQFMRRASKVGWTAGFIREDELSRVDPARWRPSSPTLMIIDYPALHPDLVGSLLRGCAAFGHEYLFPVRVLLLERYPEGDWFEKISPPNSSGDKIRSIQFQEYYEMSPLSVEEIIQIMRNRIDGRFIAPDDVLISMLERDAYIRTPAEVKSQMVPAARVRLHRVAAPLFAVATAEALAVSRNEDNLTRATALDEILRHERFLWKETPGLSAKSLRAHECLLALSTMTLGLARARVDELGPLLRYLPSDENDGRAQFEPDLLHRMTGRAPGEVLPSLEPDILGEKYVLRILEERPEIRQGMVEAALRIGGDQAIEFVTRTLTDFPFDEQAINFLRVGLDGPASNQRAYLGACIAFFSNYPDRGKTRDTWPIWMFLQNYAHLREKECSLLLARCAQFFAYFAGAEGDLTVANDAIDWLKLFTEQSENPQIDAILVESALELAMQAHDGAQDELSGQLLSWIEDYISSGNNPQRWIAFAEIASVRLEHYCEGEASELEHRFLRVLMERLTTNDDIVLQQRVAHATADFAAILGNEGDIASERLVFDWLARLSEGREWSEVREQASRLAHCLSIDFGATRDFAARREMRKWIKDNQPPKPDVRIRSF